MSLALDDASTVINGNGVHATPPPPNDTTPAVTTPATTFDPTLFRAYLLMLLPPVMGATEAELDATLFDHEFEDRVVKFAGEGGNVIYVVKVKDDIGDGMPSC